MPVGNSSSVTVIYENSGKDSSRFKIIFLHVFHSALHEKPCLFAGIVTQNLEFLAKISPIGQPILAQETQPSPINNSSGLRFAIIVAAFTLLLTMIPYIYGWSLSNSREFLWLGKNIDDSSVYLSWMRQAAEGSFRVLNLFTTEPQNGLLANPFFWLLGTLHRFTRLPLLVLFHISRLGFGFLLLLSIWRFICLTVAPPQARTIAYLLVCFSAGFGWIPFFWDSTPPTPIDSWQPEAITFLSLYLSPLFCVSMLMQVEILHHLLLAERNNQWKHALIAGIYGALLGLTHTYDVVPLALVWVVYLVFSLLTKSKTAAPTSARIVFAGIAGLLTAPSVGFIAYQLRTEAVFRARADVETLSPNIIWTFLGYGIPLILALYGIVRLLRTKPTDIQQTTTGADATRLLIVWLVMNVIAAYLPVAFQRKMLQGTHFPLAILAGIGAYQLYLQLKAVKSTQKINFLAYAITLCLVTSITNIRFMIRDAIGYANNRAETRIHRTYLLKGELAALDWIEKNTPKGTAIQPLPHLALTSDRAAFFAKDTSLACLTPAFANRPVYCGHWGETPDFGGANGKGKLTELLHFGTPKKTDAERIALLRKMKVRYLIFSQKQSSDSSPEDTDHANTLLPFFRNQVPVPNYLKLVHSNEDADVYEIVLPEPS